MLAINMLDSRDQILDFKALAKIASDYFSHPKGSDQLAYENEVIN